METTYAADPAQVQLIREMNFPARFLASGLNVHSLRTNALLRRDEWEQIDAAVQAVSMEQLQAVADLRSRNLVQNLGSLGVLISTYEQESDLEDASVNMDPSADDDDDRLEYSPISVPVPIISKGFRFNIRELEARRRNGGALDTTHVESATRKVNEKLEDILFNGSTVVVRGSAIYGYRTHPNRNQVSGGATWATATNIHPNVTAMIGALLADHYGPPYVLYLHEDQYIETLATNTNTDRTILSTLLEIPGLEAVKPASKVPTGEAVMASMRRDVVDLALAQDIVPVEWEAKGGMVQHFKVMTAVIPRVKADSAGRSGVAHMTGI